MLWEPPSLRRSESEAFRRSSSFLLFALETKGLEGRGILPLAILYFFPQR